MAQNTFQIFKDSDKKVAQSLRQIAEECKAPANTKFVFQFGDKHQKPIHTELKNFETDGVLNKILKEDSCIFYRLSLTLGHLDNVNISIERFLGVDQATIQFNDQIDPAILAQVIPIANKYLRAYGRSENLDKLLGDEIAEFYRKREQALLKLEDVLQEQYKLNGELRQMMSQDLKNEKDSLKLEYQQKEKDLHSKVQDKLADIEERERALEAKAKELDDKDSRHARRQLRKELKTALSEYSKEFTLTKTTARKRLPIHALFILVMAVIGAFLSQAFIAQFITQSAPDSLYPVIRLSLSAIAFVAIVIYYIRWNDAWFRQHADEEFRLKQLELDIDRASWLVEMSLEWAEEKEGIEIPKELLNKLAANLFASGERKDTPKHPSEDLASALINAANGVTLKTPFGEVILGKKDIKKFGEVLKTD